jgi:hypothetical protein
MSAMAWVEANARRAEDLYRSGVQNGQAPDADRYDIAEVYGHMDERKAERTGRGSSRETSNRRGQQLDSEMSDFARAIRDDLEKKRDRPRGLEM